MRTVGVALVCCLNIGVVPPDVTKPVPCARVECWVDPDTMPAQKALRTIGSTRSAACESVKRARVRARTHTHTYTHTHAHTHTYKGAHMGAQPCLS